ncbi:MAG: hypothetical protein Q4G34_04825 [Micrococcus sp.]|nr:hypothetical protein [Micrococcus sp.]
MQILRLIAYARRAWQTVLNLLRRYGGLVPALPYLRRAAGI